MSFKNQWYTQLFKLMGFCLLAIWQRHWSVIFLKHLAYFQNHITLCYLISIIAQIQL